MGTPAWSTPRKKGEAIPIKESGLPDIRQSPGGLIERAEALRHFAVLASRRRRLRGRSDLHRPPGLALEIVIQLASQPDLADHAHPKAEEA
jgi:hypothetical protein